jgi:hypothetical protein
MKVERRSLLGGAADASGIAVVIDVLRAFTCSALMFRYGVRDLALVRTPEEALAFRDADSDYLVAGEVKGRKVDSFDVGNSPADIVAKGERSSAAGVWRRAPRRVRRGCLRPRRARGRYSWGAISPQRRLPHTSVTLRTWMRSSTEKTSSSRSWQWASKASAPL